MQVMRNLAADYTVTKSKQQRTSSEVCGSEGGASCQVTSSSEKAPGGHVDGFWRRGVCLSVASTVQTRLVSGILESSLVTSSICPKTERANCWSHKVVYLKIGQYYVIIRQAGDAELGPKDVLDAPCRSKSQGWAMRR